jgi:hypothetical protein
VTLNACAQPDAGTTIKGSSFDIPHYFAASAAGAFLVEDGQAFTVAERGAKAQAAACCSPGKLTGSTESSRHLATGSVALDGTPWVVLDDDSIIDLNGNEHVAASAVQRLEQSLDLTFPAADGKPATTRGISRHVQNRAVSVLDSNAVLAATYTGPGSTLWHANDSVVYRVSKSGTPVAVAGRPAFGRARPVADLKVGESVEATAVDLQRVQALVALDQSSFVLFMVAPPSAEHPGEPRLQAAVVTNGQISRLKLPDLCADEANVVDSRISNHDVLLTALKGTGNCVRSAKHAWIRIDTTKDSFTEVGSGEGFAGIAGDQLLTATTKSDRGTSTTVTWQDLPDHP